MQKRKNTKFYSNFEEKVVVKKEPEIGEPRPTLFSLSMLKDI